jgi:hypothetical protein
MTTLNPTEQQITFLDILRSKIDDEIAKFESSDEWQQIRNDIEKHFNDRLAIMLHKKLS